MQNKIWAKNILTPDGWASDALLTISSEGRIESIDLGAPKTGTSVGILLPAPTNLHSHAFQRAMAGMTERRGPNPGDNFWAWRALMYKFLNRLTPSHVQAITAFVQMEMLEAGFGASAEFHYLHHGPGGARYDNISEMSERIAAAAQQSGIGLTLLPVLYEQAGCDGSSLGENQKRFGNNFDQYTRLLDGAGKTIEHLPNDTRLGVAPHSLRAVSPESLREISTLRLDGPVHIHAAEQVAEVDEVIAAYGARPVEYLLSQYEINNRWCFIHATQMTEAETLGLAKSGAVAGLCPITEANLGDGIFDGRRFISAGGRFGIGSDSNIRISLSEELRSLEYSQRLARRERAVLATEEKSAGRVLFEGAAIGGTQAAGRGSGQIAIGEYADLMALDGSSLHLIGRSRDAILDSYIFAGDDSMITDVWSAGRHMVKEGRHIARDTITAKYRACMESISGGM